MNSPNVTSTTKNGQYQDVKKFQALLGSEMCKKAHLQFMVVHCFVGSKNKLGDAMGQRFSCVGFKSEVLVQLNALHFAAIERESLTSGSGAKCDHLGFGAIDTELCLLTSCSALSCHCSPAGVVDIFMVRSSAYSSSGISTPEREDASCPSVSIRCCSRPSTNSPKRVARSGQPCLTPIRQSKMSEMPSWVLIATQS